MALDPGTEFVYCWLGHEVGDSTRGRTGAIAAFNGMPLYVRVKVADSVRDSDLEAKVAAEVRGLLGDLAAFLLTDEPYRAALTAAAVAYFKEARSR